MKLKIKTKTILVGILITLIGMGGIGYEVFEHIEIITIESKPYPIGVENKVIKNQYNLVDEIELDVYNYNVEFLPSSDSNQINVEVISTNYMQNYVEPVHVNMNNSKLTINSPHHRKLYNKDYYFPNDSLEFTKNNIVKFKYFVKNYNHELMKKNIIIPNVNQHYDFTQTIRIYYPEGKTFSKLDIKTNGNTVHVKGYNLDDQDAKQHLLSIINETE
ncbi:hypothetical protein [Haloplasma contractile]|uniref:Uncharacterized protein n=1 Tax=Haloplasma contractile SSD-17B TaxID=1033810 RepID=U2FKT6_9MOLU|nr:hypothetical protein [Haloplasma contractile]ERJ11829.1 hypothetical protein HLPCO_002068 [Haloplasma contractile SSD-17B]